MDAGSSSNRILHVHLHDVIMFRDGYGGGIKEGRVVGITLKGVHIRMDTETIFRKWFFIKNVENKYDTDMGKEELPDAMSELRSRMARRRLPSTLDCDVSELSAGGFW